MSPALSEDKDGPPTWENMNTSENCPGVEEKKGAKRKTQQMSSGSGSTAEQVQRAEKRAKTEELEEHEDGPDLSMEGDKQDFSELVSSLPVYQEGFEDEIDGDTIQVKEEDNPVESEDSQEITGHSGIGPTAEKDRNPSIDPHQASTETAGVCQAEEDNNSVDAEASEVSARSSAAVLSDEQKNNDLTVVETPQPVAAPDTGPGNDLNSNTVKEPAGAIEIDSHAQPSSPLPVTDVDLPSEPCPWCEDFAYGLVGFSSRQPGQMCAGCAKARACIRRCPGHKTAPLTGINPESFDFKAAYDSLTPVYGNRVEQNKWCSLCPTPAFAQCATQAVTGDGEPAGSGTGCGLLLCEPCNIMVQAVKDISLVVKKNRKEDPVDGSRADVGYLLPESALYQQ